MAAFSDPRFPRLTAYLSRLPDGIDSYPACRAKGSISRLALDGFGWRDTYEDLPEPLRAGLAERPLPSTWLPEVHSVAMHFAVVDGEKMDHQALLDWSFAANTRLAESVMYRIVVKVASPAILLRTAAITWGLLHRGVNLRIDNAGGGHASATITHPPYLWSEIVHQSTAEGLRAAILAAGGREVVSRVVDYTPDGAGYELSWE